MSQSLSNVIKLYSTDFFIYNIIKYNVFTPQDYHVSFWSKDHSIFDALLIIPLDYYGKINSPAAN